MVYLNVLKYCDMLSIINHQRPKELMALRATQKPHTYFVYVHNKLPFHNNVYNIQRFTQIVG